MGARVVLRLGLAELRTRPGRALLPGVALAAGVACLLASLALSGAVVRAATDGAARDPAVVGLVVTRLPDADAPLDQAAIDRISAVPGVTRVVPVQSVEVDLVGLDGTAPSRRAQASIELPDPALRRVPIEQGAPPAADGEVAMDRVTAYQRGLHPGDTVRIADRAGTPRDVRVSGITARGATGDQPVLVVGPALASALNPTWDTARLEVLTADPAGVRAAVAQAAGTGTVVAPPDREHPDGDAAALAIVLLPFSILALATAVFVAAATFRAVYRQRQRQTALLRCVGADRRPVVAGSLVEALVSGAVAGAVGALVSGPAALGLARVFDTTGVSAIFGAVRLRPDLLPSTGGLLLGVLVAAGLSVLAAVRPARAAARVSPVAALRTAEEPTAEAGLSRSRRVTGIVLVVAAVAFAALALVAQKSVAAIFLVLFSGIAAAGGLFLALGPVVVPALGRLFGALASRVGGAQWRLAAAEVRRVPQRSASVALPLVLAAAMITYVVALIGTVRDQAATVDQQPQADVVVSDTGGRPLSDLAQRAVTDQPQVAASVVLHRATGSQLDPDGERATTTVAGADPDRLRAVLRLSGVPDPTGFGPGTALVSDRAATRLAAHPGEPVTLDGLPGGARTATVAAVVPGSALGDADAVLADPGLAPATGVLVALRPGADPNAYRAVVRAALPNAPTVHLAARADWDAEADRDIGLASVLLMVLLGLSVAVAVTGIGTALAISVRERRTELALRRALGVTRAGLLGGVLAEAVLLALVGVLGGGALGFGYSALTTAVFGFAVLPTPPVLPLLAGALVVLVLAVLAALGPARGAAAIRPAAGLASG